VAAFGARTRVSGEFTVFDGGRPAARSSLGVHAVRDGGALLVGADPEAAWTRLRWFWCLRPLAEFLAQALERPLVLLPPVGCVRLDDFPGTAQHQAEGTDKPDRRQQRRAERMRRAYASAGARLNLAVAARALDDGEPVPLERAWPRSVAAVADGVRAGAFEPVCHGWLHLDPQELEQGRIEFREFARLDEPEAGRRLDEALAWQTDVLGRRPPTFVAPAWGYSPGALAAAAARELPAWLPASLGPMLSGGNLHESFDGALRDLYRLDYAPFAALAAYGAPPTPVLHGGLFDHRAYPLRPREAPTLARLAIRRDILRLPRTPGVRWIGAGELFGLLEAHDRIQVHGREVRLGEATRAFLFEPGARHALPAADVSRGRAVSK
jgi:peptidoglycan/xylan/chitin deacetylase (PgdA/CDA1 family)